jgi:hypothetical protein
MPEYKILVRRYRVQEAYLTIKAESNLEAEEKAKRKAERNDRSITWDTCDSLNSYFNDDPASGPNVIKTEVIKK